MKSESTNAIYTMRLADHDYILLNLHDEPTYFTVPYSARTSVRKAMSLTEAPEKYHSSHSQ